MAAYCGGARGGGGGGNQKPRGNLTRRVRFLSGPFPKANQQPLFSNSVGNFGHKETPRRDSHRWIWSEYYGVSFRIGAATSARVAGLSEEKYNYWEDGGQIAIGSMLKPTLTGYITRPADTNSLENHDFPSQEFPFPPQRFHNLVHQPTLLFPPKLVLKGMTDRR